MKIVEMKRSFCNCFVIVRFWYVFVKLYVSLTMKSGEFLIVMFKEGISNLVYFTIAKTKM